MILTRLNKTYFIVSGLLYLTFLYTSGAFISLYVLNIVTFLIYLYLLLYCFEQPKSFYSPSHLVVIVFVYTSLMVIIYNYITYIYTDNFFMFDATDPMTYHRHSLIMASKSFYGGIKYYLRQGYTYDDLGAVLIQSTLYRLIPSKFFLDFFFIICGLFATLGIYRISSNFMSQRYAFVCCLAYSLSSCTIFYHASGRKETFMCMLIVLFFDRYYQFRRNGAFIHLAYAAIFLLGLLFFRPAIIFLVLGSVCMGVFIQRGKGKKGPFLLILIFASIIVLRPVFKSTFDSFLRGGDINRVIEVKKSENMVKGSVRFTYAVNLLAQLIGPLPTISSGTKAILSFYSPGLIYRVLLASLFWLGTYYVFQLKLDALYPLIFFAFLEMAALLSILEGLELRKSMPHFFVFYVIAFWFMDHYESGKKTIISKNRWKIRMVFSLSSVLAFCLVLAWNIRNQMQ